MAKIVSQVSVFDYYEIEVLGDLERLTLALEGIDDEALMRKLEKQRGRGRNDYPIRVMWNLCVAMKVFGHRTVASFRRELSRNAQLRKICGLDDFSRKRHIVPPERVFTGFMKLLIKEQDEIDRIFSSGVASIFEELPKFGVNTAGDGKYIDSYAKRPTVNPADEVDERTESDAKFSIKEYHYTTQDGKKHTKKETHYGFKAHIIVDVATELPMTYTVTAANYDEKAAMKELLADKLTREQRERMKTLALDRGYDSSDMIRRIKSYGIAPVVDIRNCWKDSEETKQYKDTNIVYDYCGNVYFCNDDGKNVKMKYEGYDRTKKCLRYSYKRKIHKIYISADERVFLPIARDSKKFSRLYKGRTSVERLNGRLDRDFMFEDHCMRGLKKTKLFTCLSLIIMNGMAISKIRLGQTDGLAAFVKTAVRKAA